MLMATPGSELLVQLDGRETGRVNSCAQDWQTRQVQTGQRLEAGTHEVKISVVTGAATIEWLDLR